MNEELLRLAREAGFDVWPGNIDEMDAKLLRFAALVAEECAKACDKVQARHEAKAERNRGDSDPDNASFRDAEACGAEDCAADIRAAFKP